MDWDKIKPELRKPLDPKNVRPAPRGKFGEYVDGYHVVTEANRIFGEDGWSYTVTRLEKVSEQTVPANGKDQYRVGYLATVRVDVGGVIREGCAVGSGVGSPATIADHHESAVKEAETDALKRALRCFGNTFGLALYEKEKTNVRKPDGEDGDASKADMALSERMLNGLRQYGMRAVNDPKLQSDLAGLKARAPELAAHVEAAIENMKLSEKTA